MPTKPNKAGQQQNYVPAGNGDASGEYGDNESGSNIHFKNFKKPQESSAGDKPKQEKPSGDIGVKVEKKGKKPADTSKIKPKYDGKGKQILADALSKKMGKSKNYKTVVEQLQDADDEMSGVIGDFYGANPLVNLKIGKNVNSKYVTKTGWSLGQLRVENSVEVGQGLLTEQGYYSKGGVFFHESGHVLDDTFVDSTGHKNQWSYGYISKKHGKPMFQMVKEEIREYKDQYQKIKAEIENERKSIENKYWNASMANEFDSLKIKVRQIKDEADEATKEYYEKANKKLDEVAALRRQYYGTLTDEAWNNLTKARNEYNEICDQREQARKELISKKYPEFDKMVNRMDEIAINKSESLTKSKEEICRKYGDLSDMFMAAGLGDLCGMGHNFDYWTPRHVGNEAFAEITSAKATNKDSLELMKKYIPKTLEIYDEIMDNIRNKKDVYYKA